MGLAAIDMESFLEVVRDLDTPDILNILSKSQNANSFLSFYNTDTLDFKQIETTQL